MMDTGIWPESQSFDDKGLGPPPKKWKGGCHSSSNITCNNKIIGAKSYARLGRLTSSARDVVGHGTHTASIVAGGVVVGANFYGLAAGTARGGVPSARIAVYKVCSGSFEDGCTAASLLAAIDDAIADGVDIISISLAGTPAPYFKDPIAIGAFHAMKNGILVSNAVGNSGPLPKSIYNFSPWSLSVGASTINRKFQSKVLLGNNKTYQGSAVNPFTLKDGSYPLVYAGNVPNTARGYNGSTSMYCTEGSLDPNLVKGSIVLCEGDSDFAQGAADAGAIGAIMVTDAYTDLEFTFPIPACYLGFADGDQVRDYIKNTSKPAATIFKSTEANNTLAPFVVFFSSRGPNPITRDILKPDLTAPGVDILAAWSEAKFLIGHNQDKIKYNILSGTSMSCPHASAAAAYVKSFNPTWSPAAIKSALMTTASSMSSEINPDAEFAYGSGHFNPFKAKSPGLVYDIGVADYVKFLCGQGLSTSQLRLITGDKNTDCNTASNNIMVYDLNYPSFSVSGASGSSVSAVFHRTVTNVGSPSSTYKAHVIAPSGINIQVQPNTLSFTLLGQNHTFVVVVNATVTDAMLSASLVWDDGVYQVRSPIVAHTT
ncbi:hypothetical protein C2S51_009090 [Perilla frutescens var. frutescens]|nr:hypothetical protein C2S51_009090 [Perilla frutescens var. frutescens]